MRKEVLSALQGMVLILLLLQGACSGGGNVSGSDTPVPVSVALVGIPTDVDCGNSIVVKAQVQGTSEPWVAWAVEGVPNGNASVGTITERGGTVAYTAPEHSGSYLLTATSTSDSTKSASSKLNVRNKVASVAVAPTFCTLPAGAQYQFAAILTGVGDFNHGVTWTAQCGSITSSGIYTAPSSSGSDVVTVRSLQDTSKSASASITVGVPSTITSVTVSPATVALNVSGQQQFTAAVIGTGAYNSGVTWTTQRGSITSSGLYTAPLTAGDDLVTVGSVQTPGMKASASVTVTASTDPGSTGLPRWTGTGKTITVAAGGDIQAAVNEANAGDTIQLADGIWTGVHVAIPKKLRLKAVNPLGARLQGHVQPMDGTDGGISIYGASSAGTFIQDLDVSWYGDHSIAIEGSGNVVISGCQIETTGNFGILLWGTVDVLVYGNSFFDPYLAGMLPTLVDNVSNSNWEANNNLVLMDYAIAAYGSVRTEIVQNYFHGEFNQVVSFKEGNRDYTVKSNTFEGFTGTGILCGQNVSCYGPYTYSGQPKSIDTGTLHISGNVFRPVVGLQRGQLAEYRGNSAIRMGHLNQALVYVSGNIIEAAITGLSVEMGMNGSAGGPTGTLYADHNIINGDIYDDGTMVSPTAKARNVGSWRAVLLHSGVPMNVVIANDTYANSACAIQNDGLTGTLTINRTIFLNTRTTLSGSGTATNSLFWPTSALPGAGNVVADPQIENATVALRKFNPVAQAPTSDLTTRFRPRSSSPAKLSDGTYAGAIAP